MKFFAIFPFTGLLFCTLVNGAVVVPPGHQRIFVEGPKCPVDDPLLRPEWTPINVTMDPITGFTNGSYIKNLNLIGVSSLRYNLSINWYSFTATFDLTIGKLEGTGKYHAEGYVDVRPLPEETAPSGNFSGSGDAHFLIEGVSLKGSAQMHGYVFENSFDIVELSLSEIKFDKMILHFDNYTIGEKLMDWEAFNGGIKQNFDRDWSIHREALTEKIRRVANNYCAKYTFDQLYYFMQNGGPDCEEKVAV